MPHTHGLTGLTRAQGIALVSTSTCSSTLSMAGSWCILRQCFCCSPQNNSRHHHHHNNNNNSQRRLYHRILSWLSVLDILLSGVLLLQPWLVQEEYGYAWSVGTTASCTTVGLWMRLPLGMAILQAYLSWFFVQRVTVVGVNDDTTNSKSWHARGETAVVGLALGLPTLFGVVAAATESINPIESLQICDLGPFPPGCDDHTNTDDDGNRSECQRGATYLRQDWIYLGCLTAASALAMYGLVRVTWTVGRRLGSSVVATQAVLYTAAYLNGVFWSLLFRSLLDARRHHDHHLDVDDGVSGPLFALQLLAYWFFPLQGFLNFGIFVRPRWLRRRQRHPQEGRLVALRRILQAKSSSPPLGRRSTRVSHVDSRRYPVVASSDDNNPEEDSIGSEFEWNSSSSFSDDDDNDDDSGCSVDYELKTDPTQLLEERATPKADMSTQQ